MKLPSIDEPKVAEVKSKIDSMVGLGRMKKEVNGLIFDAINDRQREEQGLPVTGRRMHMQFVGPSGTGKTTVANQIGPLYKALGLLPSGQVVSPSKTELIGTHLGDTQKNVRDQFMKARGGVLFIDEAYGLVNGEQDIYGHAAITELVELMEKYKDDTVVILAGYGPDMKKLMRTNSGLPSRMSTEIHFDPYNTDQLEQIFGLKAKEYQATFEPGAKPMIREALGTITNGNARDADNLFQSIRKAQAARNAVAQLADPKRATPQVKELRRMSKADVAAGVERWMATRVSTGDEPKRPARKTKTRTG